MWAIEGLWGGELPEFDSMEDAQALIDALMAGLWNRLTQHQARQKPFHLTRLSLPKDSPSLSHYARVRLEEIEGFVNGLFGDSDAIDLPERAHRAVEALADLRSFMIAYAEFSDEYDSKEQNETVSQLAKLSRIAETEMNAAVLSCARARRHHLETLSVVRPTLH